MGPDVVAFRMDELAPALLSTRFHALTNWIVIAGAPSCGKTTLIDGLAARGFRTVPEAARAYIESEITRGRTIENIHSNGAALQRILVEVQAADEDRLPPGDQLFLDGALPLSLAWYRAFGLDPNAIVPRCLRHRCAGVFLLDALPLDADGVRFNEPELASFLDRWIERDFSALRYDVIRVPVLPLEGRVAFVLDRLGATPVITPLLPRSHELPAPPAKHLLLAGSNGPLL